MSSRQSQKGARFEYAVRDLLTARTGVEWARAPSSGSGTIKGDLFCPTAFYYHCFECKSYKDSVIQENLLTAKSNNLVSWWKQAVVQADHMRKIPAVVFKRDRGKTFIAIMEDIPELSCVAVRTEHMDVHIYLFEEWLEHKKLEELIHEGNI